MRLPIRLNRQANRRRWPLLALGLGAVALLAAACGGGSPTSAHQSTSNSHSGSPTSRPTPGASGEIAALTPPSMEVQNPENGQTTVSWTSSTTFTQTVTSSLSSVVAGDCVSISGTPSSPGSSSSPISARTVSIMPASSSGTCASPATVFGGNASGGSGFQFSGRSPSGTFPGGHTFTTTPGQTFPQISSAFGQVASVSSSGFVVNGTELNARLRPGSGSSTTTTTTPPKTDITVTTTSSTTVEQTQSASASNLSLGECVTAIGPSSSTGAVTANSISIRQPVNGECFGGGGAGFFGGGGGGGGGGIVSGGGSSASND